MKVRIIFGAIAVAVFLPILIFSGSFIYPTVMAILSLIACYELLGCTRLIYRRVFFVLSLLFAAFTPVAARYFGGISAIALSAGAYLLLTVIYMVITQQTEILNRVYSVCTQCIYVVCGFSSLILVRDSKFGVIMMVLVYLTAWLTDTFAYFSGALFGKHKLIPKLSPKKTVEGAIGGILLTLFISFCVLLGVGMFSETLVPNYLALMLLILSASAISQIGDLAMSQIKRYYNVKDYGKIMPGHGGVLDRFDSVLAVSLTVTLFIYTFTNVKLF